MKDSRYIRDSGWSFTEMQQRLQERLECAAKDYKKHAQNQPKKSGGRMYLIKGGKRLVT